MTSFRRACVSGLAAGAGALAFGTVASPPSAATFTLNMSAPATAIVAQPFVIQASGTDPTDQGALYLEIDSIVTSVATSCPSGYLNAAQLATSTGGDLVAFDQRENLDAAGGFSMPLGYTPKAAGQWLFCGYTDDGATDTLATSSAPVNIQAARRLSACLRVPACRDREAGRQDQAARGALGRQAPLQRGRLVQRPEQLRVPMARERQGKEGGAQRDARRHPQAAWAQGAVQRTGLQRRRRRHCGQRCLQGPLRSGARRTASRRLRATDSSGGPPRLVA
jgi:hypothetical protein